MTLLLLALLAVPEVVLSEAHAKQTLVGVGDAFPEVATTSPTGGQGGGLASLLGPKGTVVAVVRGEGWQAMTLLGDLQLDVAGPYGDKGVAAIAIGIDAQPKAPAEATPLSATAADAEAKLGAGRMPRVYVLDAKGKVVWLDLEYSLASRRELRATLDELTAQ
ncbi:MAG: hypothetical protein ACRCT8_09435 [Lacipirellulaceae bacterium]